VAVSVTDFVPSLLCAMLPLVTVPSFVVRPPSFLTAGELQVCDVPAMAVVLSLLDDMLIDQPEDCTRYMDAVIFDVLLVTF
jgi:hypothetical protein